MNCTGITSRQPTSTNQNRYDNWVWFGFTLATMCIKVSESLIDSHLWPHLTQRYDIYGDNSPLLRPFPKDLYANSNFTCRPHYCLRSLFVSLYFFFIFIYSSWIVCSLELATNYGHITWIFVVHYFLRGVVSFMSQFCRVMHSFYGAIFTRRLYISLSEHVCVCVLNCHIGSIFVEKTNVYVCVWSKKRVTKRVQNWMQPEHMKWEQRRAIPKRTDKHFSTTSKSENLF